MTAEKESCVFCDIVAGKAAAYKVCEDELSLALLDINPYAQGHCLVIPKRHVPWWHELTETETSSLFRMAREVGNGMMQVFRPDFVCMYARGRRIPHTHIFLIPTYGGDVLDRFFNALEKFQESPPELVQLRETESLAEAADLLRSACSGTSRKGRNRGCTK